MAQRSAGLLVRLGKAALKDSETCLQQAKRHASQDLRYTSSDGKYSPGLFTRTTPVDRSAQWVTKNPYIEAWYYRRDHFEKDFVWNNRTTIEAVWFLGGFTLGFYYLSKWCLAHSDRRSGYPKRTILGDEPGFTLPDEREFY